jgi:phage tail-like protein
MPTGKRNDPFPAHIFAVEIGGVIKATFSECSGLQGEVEIFEYQEGGENGYIHRLPGRTKWTNLSLKRGLTDCPELHQWYADALHNKITRHDMSVVIYNQSGEEVRRWNIRAAYPVKWVGPQLKAGATEVAIETLELAHHGIEQVK